MSGRELVDVAVQIVGETDRAYRLFDGSRTEWFPKSMVELDRSGINVVATMPEWLAADKGFI